MQQGEAKDELKRVNKEIRRVHFENKVATVEMLQVVTQTHQIGVHTLGNLSNQREEQVEAGNQITDGMYSLLGKFKAAFSRRIPRKWRTQLNLDTSSQGPHLPPLPPISFGNRINTSACVPFEEDVDQNLIQVAQVLRGLKELSLETSEELREQATTICTIDSRQQTIDNSLALATKRLNNIH
ncbi:hypothetical protein Pelo_13038 [Pelomyxa schiedti]|nr:hypothetical protein Pelo_13038 [Pelomyxa schiedti]